MPKRAFVTGITGQDGAYLAALLLEKGYQVWGMVRRSSVANTGRLAAVLDHPDLHLATGDMTVGADLLALIGAIRPDEVYNLAAQSHVGESFAVAEYTADVAGLGALRLLEAVRVSGSGARVYQASTSEMFGNSPPPQNEATAFRPRSPYALAKHFAHDAAATYRDAYGMHVTSGILFNHESPFRGEAFVTRKISLGVARIQAGSQEKLHLGNLDAKRDWGHAKDYVRGMWLMVQQDQPDDYVLATGETHTVRDFVELAFGCVGRRIAWAGEGPEELGLDADTGQTLVAVDPALYRPAEVNVLRGDAAKARAKLGWAPTIELPALVAEMVAHDLKAVGRG